MFRNCEKCDKEAEWNTYSNKFECHYCGHSFYHYVRCKICNKKIADREDKSFKIDIELWYNFGPCDPFNNEYSDVCEECTKKIHDFIEKLKCDSKPLSMIEELKKMVIEHLDLDSDGKDVLIDDCLKLSKICCMNNDCSYNDIKTHVCSHPSPNINLDNGYWICFGENKKIIS